MKINFKRFSEQRFIQDLLLSDLKYVTYISEPELELGHFCATSNSILIKYAPIKRVSGWNTDPNPSSQIIYPMNCMLEIRLGNEPEKQIQSVTGNILDTEK